MLWTGKWSDQLFICHALRMMRFEAHESLSDPKSDRGIDTVDGEGYFVTLGTEGVMGRRVGEDAPAEIIAEPPGDGDGLHDAWRSKNSSAG